MFCLCSWAAAGTSVALTGERTTTLSHKYICRGKSSVSNMRKSQVTAQTGLSYQDQKSATYSHLPPSPVLSNPLAESNSSKAGSKWWICLLLPVFHAFIQEDSHHRAHSRTWQDRAHLIHLASDKPLYHTLAKTRHSVKQLKSCLSLLNQSQAWDSYDLVDPGSYQTSAKQMQY